MFENLISEYKVFYDALKEQDRSKFFYNREGVQYAQHTFVMV